MGICPAGVEWFGRARSLLHGLGLDGGSILALFLVGMDAQVDLNAFPLGSRLNKAADGRGGETLASDERCNVRLAENKSKVHLVVARVPDPEFGEFGVLDELESDILDEILELGGDCFHDVKFCRSLA